MLERLDAGEDTIDVTIAKYRELPNYWSRTHCFTKGHYPNGMNCALCEDEMRNAPYTCDGCPLDEDEWQCDKGGSPYCRVIAAETAAEFRAACDNMVDILEGVKAQREAGADEAAGQ